MTTIIVNGSEVDIDVDVATPNELRWAAGYGRDFDFFEIGKRGSKRKITNEDCAVIEHGKRFDAIRNTGGW